MSLCINPRCPQPNHPDNDASRICQACGSELVLQGRYRIMRLLSNQSGFGWVYEAFERNVPKLLKVLKEDYNHNEKVLELFQREADVLRQLNHPGVPAVESDGYFLYQPQGSKEPLHCLVMEKIDGPNLRQWMQQQGNYAISEQQAMLWLTQLVDVLHLVHQQNYFHRDIKPENIMLRSNGQLVLVDFGAAREMTETYVNQLGASGITAVSSAGYTPPEQEQGQAVPQSDFYALGRTLTYLLTAKSPNDASIYDSRTNAYNWRIHAPQISPDFAQLIDNLIAPRAIDRPQTTQDILERLAQVRAHQSLTPHTLSSQPAIHQPWPTTTLEEGSAVVHPTTSLQPEQTKLESLLTPKWLVGGLLALALLAMGIPAVWLAARNGGILSSPTATPAVETVPTDEVKLIKSLPGHRGGVKALVLLADGKTLISGSDDTTIRIWDLVQGAELKQLQGHTSFVNSLALTPDHQTLISGGADGKILFWDIASGEALATIDPAHDAVINAVQVSRDGKVLASASSDGDLKLWDIETQAPIATLSGHDSAINDIVFSRDNRFLVSAGQAIWVWDLNSEEGRLLYEGDGSFINKLEVSFDNRLLISAGADQTIRLWNLSNGEWVSTLTGHTSYVNDLMIPRDGQTFLSASADQTVRVWDINTGQLRRVLTGFNEDIYRFVMRPEGQLVTAGGEDDSLRVWLPAP